MMTSTKHIYLWLVGISLCLLSSCTYQSTDHHNKWTLTQKQRDSIAFSTRHHYNVGYNFICTADSIWLAPHPEGTTLNLDYPHEEVYLYEDDDFVVTEIFRNPNVTKSSLDSIWLCVGSDGIPLGWISEYDLHHKTTPVDPISRFMDACSRLTNCLDKLVGHNIIIILLICLIAFQMRASRTHILKEKSIYTSLLLLSAITSGCVLATIKCLTPELWQHFYYYPSLNPVGQPPMLALYLSTIWLSIILFLAIFFDLKDKTSSFGRLLLTISLAAILAILLYYICSILRPIYLVCIVYVVLVAAVLWDIILNHKKDKTAPPICETK